MTSLWQKQTAATRSGFTVYGMTGVSPYAFANIEATASGLTV